MEAIGDDEKEYLHEQILDEADTIASQLGVMDALHFKDEDKLTDEERKPINFYKTATGKLHPIAEFKDEWLLTIERERTRTDYNRAVTVLQKHYAVMEELDWEKADRFLKSIGKAENVKTPTVQKWRGAYVNFWNWAGKDPKVWQGHSNLPKHRKLDKQPWTAEEVAYLYHNIRTANNPTSAWLKDAVWIAAHTGARQGGIAELVYDSDKQTIFIPAKKKEERDRIIPAHPAIRDNLKAWDTNRRSRGSISNRFTEFKTKLGFGEEKDFHSFRRTFITMMENLEAPENVVADIVGHKKATISYGVYSGGTKLPLMEKFLFQLEYPKVS
jgi:integrase